GSSDLPVVAAAHPQVADDVVVRQDVAAGADDRPRAGPADGGAGLVVVRDDLHHGLHEVEPDFTRQALCAGHGGAGENQGRYECAYHAHGPYLQEPDRVLTRPLPADLTAPGVRRPGSTMRADVTARGAREARRVPHSRRAARTGGR